MKDLIIPGETISEGTDIRTNTKTEAEEFGGLNIPVPSPDIMSSEVEEPKFSLSTLGENLKTRLMETLMGQRQFPQEFISALGGDTSSPGQIQYSPLGKPGEQSTFTVPTAPYEKVSSGVGRSWDHPTVRGAIEKSARAFNKEATLGLSTLIPGQEVGPVAGWENIPVGISATAGFLLGAPGKIAGFAGKQAIKRIPWLELVGHEGKLARLLKTVGKDVPSLSAAMTASSAGEALKQDNINDALDVLGEAAKGGAIMGTVFGGTKGVYWKEAKDRIKRLALGTALLDYSRGTTPWDERSGWEKIKDYGIDLFFLWHGVPDAFSKLERDVVEKIKSEPVDPELEKNFEKLEERLGTTRKIGQEEKTFYEDRSKKDVEKDAKLGVELAKEELIRRKVKKKEVTKEIPEFKPEDGKVTKSKRVSKDGKYLNETKKLKRKLGNKEYYKILEELGVEKSNQVTSKIDKAKVLNALKRGIEKPAEELPEKQPYDSIMQELKESLQASKDFIEKEPTPGGEVKESSDYESVLKEAQERLKSSREFLEETPVLKRKEEKELETAKAPEEKAAEEEIIKEPVEEPAEDLILTSGRTPWKTEAGAKVRQRGLERKGVETEVVEVEKGKFALRKVKSLEEQLGIEEEPQTELIIPGEPEPKLAKGEEPFGEKIPIEKAKELPKDPNKARRDIAERVQRLRKGEELDIDEIEDDMETLVVSKSKNDFDESWEYDQFVELNDTALDLIRKVREEKGLVREKATQKIQDRVLKDMEDLINAESLEEFEESRKGKDYEEIEDWEGLLEEEGMPKGLVFDTLGQQQIYEKAIEVIRKSPSLESLRNISRGIMLEGKTGYVKFHRRMKEITGELWDSIKGFVKESWTAAKDWNKKVGEKGRIVLTEGNLSRRLSTLMKDEKISTKEALMEKQNLKTQILKGVKSGEFEGAVRFGNVKELKAIVKTGKLAISDEYGVIHAQPILGKDDTAFAAYGSHSKHNAAMIVPKKYLQTDPEAATKEVLVDPKTPVEEVTFLVGNEKMPVRFDELVRAGRERPSEVTLDFLGLQQLTDRVTKRLAGEIGKQKRLTSAAIRKRDKVKVPATEVDLGDIRNIGFSKGFEENEITKMAGNVFGWRKKLEDLSRPEADLLKLKLAKADPKVILENARKIDKMTRVKDTTKKALRRAVRTYDVDDAELAEYMETWSNDKGELTNDGVNKVIASIRYVNEIRPEKGRIVFAYLAPAKRILGEKFIAPWRKAEMGKLEEESPYLKRVIDVTRDLNKRSFEDITRFFEGELKKEDLSPDEIKAAETFREVYNDLFEVFEIAKSAEFVNDYSPRIKSAEDLKKFTEEFFSRKGIGKFSFWAESKRTGQMSETEMDAKNLIMAYIRAGFSKKYYGKALEEVEPIIKDMRSDQQASVRGWIDTVVKKRPTADEMVVERFVKGLMRGVGMKVNERERYFKRIVGEVLDLNYSAFMGMRPKLALRNLTQQMLIANEFGFKAYLRGRTGKGRADVQEALEKSDAYKLRKKQYVVMEERADRISDLPSELRQKMMWFYRLADLDSVQVAFATGYLRAKKLSPNIKESYAIRAGEKAIHNTQWGYGIDLPYLFKTPTGKFFGQYMSWPIWYFDHLRRMVAERNTAGMARTAVHAIVISLLLDKFDVDYTRTILLGVMPESLGYGPQSVLSMVHLIKTLGMYPLRATSEKDVEQATKRAGDMVLGLLPGYLAAKDVKKFIGSGDISEAMFYKKKRKSSGGGLGGL